MYDVAEKLVDQFPDRLRTPHADFYLNNAYDQLKLADKHIEVGRIFVSFKAYPSYTPVKLFWSKLEKRSDEQKGRLDRHLRHHCLEDSGDLLPRRDAANAAIDGMLNIYESRDNLFKNLERNDVNQGLTDRVVRVLDGVIESSIDCVEIIADVLCTLTSTKLTARS